jgi:hypothetical protein
VWFISQVRQAYAAVSALNRELIHLQQSNAEFAAQLEAAGTRGELQELKRRLEAHQTILSQWEEKVARQLEFITELQSPSRRQSTMLLTSASSRHLSSAMGMSGMGGVGGLMPAGSATAAALAAAAAAAVGMGSPLGSPFSTLAGGRQGGMGGSAPASAPASPVMWGDGGSVMRGAGGGRRVAFTPGPLLSGAMGE